MAKTGEAATDDEAIVDEDSFVRHIVDQYKDGDRADAAKEDGLDGDGEEDGDADADDDDEEHTDADTSDEADDEPSDDSDADSSDADDAEHTDEESDSAEDGDATDDDDDAVDDDDDAETGAADDKDDEDDAASAETKAALARAGADLTLEDVPEKFRPMLEKKIKGIDAAFTRYAQEAAETRKVRAEAEAFKRFQKDNPGLVLAEMLHNKDGTLNQELFDELNAKLRELADPTVAEAFQIVVQKKKDDARAAVTEEIGKEDRTEARIVEVETTTRKLAADQGVPFWIADEAIGTAYLLKKRADPNSDLTKEEIAATVARVAKNYRLEHRTTKRNDSKDEIRTRTENRKKNTPTKKPASASSPRPNGKKPEVVDYNSEESRQRAMLKSARRIIPGGKDG